MLSDTPAAPAPVVAAPVEPAAATTEPEVASENKVNVIGKIDLDAINQRTRPDKKKDTAAPKEASKEETKAAPAPVAETAPTAPTEAPAPESNPAPQAPDAPAEIETIRVARQTLSGPTVLGKIELPVERPRTPVASSSDDANSKRKRKRIKKEVPSTGNNTGGNNQARPKTEKAEISEQDIQKEIKDMANPYSAIFKESKLKSDKQHLEDIIKN